VRGFVAYPSMSVVLNDDFGDTTEISEAFARHVVSPAFPPEAFPVRCTATAQALPGGVRLRFTSSIANLDRDTTIAHRFYFVDRDESRERLHVVSPAEPAATSEVLVLFGPGDRQRDYCHASVYDRHNYVLATHSLVFDTRGSLVSYPFTRRYVSPLRVGRAEVTETRDAAGHRVLRFRVRLLDLRGPQRVTVAWQTMGVIRRDSLVCTPAHPEVCSDLDLDDNPTLAPGDWSLIAVDEHERLIAQTLVTVTTVARGCAPGAAPGPA
jgi:hypothetical protein